MTHRLASLLQQSSTSTRIVSGLCLVAAAATLPACSAGARDESLDERGDALSATRSGPGYELEVSVPAARSGGTQSWSFGDAPTLAIPGVLDIFTGADGDAKASLAFKSSGGSTTCTYASSAASSPQTIVDLIPSTKMQLLSCSPSMKAGAVLKGVAGVTLTAKRSSTLSSWALRATLPVAGIFGQGGGNEVARQLVLVRHPKFPGQLAIDASDGRGIFKLSDTGRTYKTQQDLISDVVSKFGAVPRTKDGLATTFNVRAFELGKPIYVYAKGGATLRNEDLLAAYLGGLEQAVTVGGRRFDLGTAAPAIGTVGQALGGTRPPQRARSCSGTMCVEAESFNPNYWIYASLGSESRVASGGYDEHGYFCWNGWIPWWCIRRTGKSLLSLRMTYSGALPNGCATNREPLGFQANNVMSIKHKVWGVFGSLEMSFDGSITDGSAGTDLLLSGVETGHGYSGSGAALPGGTSTSVGALCE
jgi:hypothetical protein